MIANKSLKHCSDTIELLILAAKTNRCRLPLMLPRAKDGLRDKPAGV
jgi:hypothetical protein